MTPTTAKPTFRWPALIGLLLALSSGLVGCQGYQLQGTVVQGPQSAIVVVGKNDPRLGLPGVSGAALNMTIDPRSLNADMLPMEVSDPQGRFTVSVPHAGAGVLEYEVEVLCRAAGFIPVARTMKLPSSGKRLLVILSPGEDNYKQQRDILEETMEMGRQLTPGK